MLTAALVLLAPSQTRAADMPDGIPHVSGGTLVRVKDVASILEARDNQLVGYGLVVGLAGTGDSAGAAPFTPDSVRSMLDQLGVPADREAIGGRNVASVIVTARLGPHAKPGNLLDATVSALGDAVSLRGGTLVLTPLIAGDGEIYAVAQGSLLVGGFAAAGQAEAVQEGVPTVARLASAVLVEREAPAQVPSALLTLTLRDPDFATAVRLTDAINQRARAEFGIDVAREMDAGTVSLAVPPGMSATRLVAMIEPVTLYADTPARVVVDERSGTVVVGENVRVGRVAIAHGAMTIRVTEAPRVVQPNPFSLGETATEPATEVAVMQEGDRMALVDGPSLRELVAGLNALGVGPDGIISILRALKTSGALHAELIVQ